MTAPALTDEIPVLWSLDRNDLPARVTVEEQLLARMAHGDSAALDEFYRLFADRVYSVACRLLQDAEDAREVLQDVFVRIWEKAGQYDAALSSPAAWAVLITRGLCLDRLRRHSRRHARMEQYRAATAETTPREDGRTSLLSREMTERVRRAVAQLPAEERACVTLVVFEEFTWQEVAQRLALPEGTARTRLRRGLIRLRQFIRQSHD